MNWQFNPQPSIYLIPGILSRKCFINKLNE